MIMGTYSVPRVTIESSCQSCEKYQFTSKRTFKIHSIAMTPNIPFGSPMVTPSTIDPTIFINNDTCKPDFPRSVNIQNYLTTKFVGILPYEDYTDGHYTPAGTQFTLICRNGNPNADYRVFGTSDGVHGYGTTDTVKRTNDGLVPALPEDNDTRKFLRGDGKWVIPKEHDLDP